MEEELHAPDIDAAGVSFVGINLYVVLGRGRDYAWSATSAGQDITDVFAERLCEPGGGAPTVNSMHYLWKGRCLPIEVLDRVNNITPNAADPSPAQTFRLQAQRTIHGVIRERGTVDGKPVAFAALRSTYFHEADSALGFSKFNPPSQIQNARDFQEAANDIGFTFNWFYADDRDISYFNSGFNPVRAKGRRPRVPELGHRQVRLAGLGPEHERLAPRRRSTPTRRSSTRTTSPAGTTSRRRASRLPRTPTPSARSTAPTRSNERIEGGIAGAKQADPGRADRRDGGRRYGGPARQPGAARRC